MDQTLIGEVRDGRLTLERLPEAQRTDALRRLVHLETRGWVAREGPEMWNVPADLRETLQRVGEREAREAAAAKVIWGGRWGGEIDRLQPLELKAGETVVGAYAGVQPIGPYGNGPQALVMETMGGRLGHVRLPSLDSALILDRVPERAIVEVRGAARARPIGIRALFTGEADTDHIIPYSQSLDDSAGNKIIAHRSCNRQKGNKTPYECWGHDDARWETISVQVARMHRSKQWRFGPGARERLDKDGGFLARQLTDTQYLSKTTAKYLSFLYRPDEGRRVYALPGRMTAMLRRVWGLNSLLPDHNYVENAHSNAPKNRLDHRHHIIDGMVAAVTDMGLIRKIATASARAEEKKLDRIFEQLAPPWPSFRDDLKERLTRVTVSHKPDHGRKGRPEKSRDVTGGRLHNDTAYGFTGQVAADGKTPIVVHRIVALLPAVILGSVAPLAPPPPGSIRR